MKHYSPEPSAILRRSFDPLAYLWPHRGCFLQSRPALLAIHGRAKRFIDHLLWSTQPFAICNDVSRGRRNVIPNGPTSYFVARPPVVMCELTVLLLLAGRWEDSQWCSLINATPELWASNYDILNSNYQTTKHRWRNESRMGIAIFLGGDPGGGEMREWL